MPLNKETKPTSNKQIEIMPMAFAIWGTVYSWTFFKEFSRDYSFHATEDYQHDLLYWPLRLETFLFFRETVSFHSMSCLFVSGSKWQTHVNSFFFLLFFLRSMFLRTHRTFFCNFKWFALPVHIDERHLFKFGVLCLLYRHFE